MESQIARRLEALVGIFLQAMEHDAIEPWRYLRIGSHQIRRILLEDGAGRVRRSRACKGPVPRKYFIEHSAEGKYVGPRIGGLSAHLLRRHISCRAEDRALFGLGGWNAC